MAKVRRATHAVWMEHSCQGEGIENRAANHWRIRVRTIAVATGIRIDDTRQGKRSDNVSLPVLTCTSDSASAKAKDTNRVTNNRLPRMRNIAATIQPICPHAMPSSQRST